MGGVIKIYRVSTITSLLCLFIAYLPVNAEDINLGTIRVKESHGLSRQLEYVEYTIQVSDSIYSIDKHFVVTDAKTGQTTVCQSVIKPGIPKQKIKIITIIFPVAINPNSERDFILEYSERETPNETDLSYDGEGLEIQVDNQYYRADLSRSDQSEAKSHSSGQLRELLIKMGYNITLLRSENRMHWGPNFQRTDQEYYKTISAWENPKEYNLYDGPYLIRTERQDLAPNHPEILLSATYSFYAGLPYFRFYSSMRMVEDVWIKLLRNDEMTMDTLFTHVAFQRPDGQIEDLAFSTRYKRLKEQPLENNAPWLCFYNKEKGYAYGSIRIKYEIDNQWGKKSPVYNPHTKISDGAGGGKYWNRRLIDEYPMYVPKDSRYMEENAYLVFSISQEDKFKEINVWADRLRHPLEVVFSPLDEADRGIK